MMRTSAEMGLLSAEAEATQWIHPFGFLGGVPSGGLSYFAWMSDTRFVEGSFSKDVAVMGKGTLRRPTDFPGARRK